MASSTTVADKDLRADHAESIDTWSAPEALRAFLCDHVRSHDGLEILQVLAQPPARWLSTIELAVQLHLTERAVADTVQSLIDARLLTRSPDGSQFAYRGNDCQQELVEASLVAYREHPTEVVRLLTSRAVTRVRISLNRLSEKLLRYQLLTTRRR